jgi:transcription elongation factor
MAKDINGKEIKIGDWLVDTKGDGLDGIVEHIDGSYVLLFGQDEWVKANEFKILKEKYKGLC